MNKAPKISIITACYNAEKTIEQTIQSVLNQTYDNIEYIIIDGASTDGTMGIVGKYSHYMSKAISEPDKGIYDAFNKGLLHATGDYIQYLNADDYLIDDNIIEKIVEQIINHEYPVSIYGGILKKNEDTGYILELNREVLIDEIEKGMMIPHPATFIKRECIFECDGFDTQYKIAADYNLICKLYQKYCNQFIHVSLLVTVFRYGGISTDLNYQHILTEEVSKIVNDHFNKTYIKKDRNSNELHLKKWLTNKFFKHRSISDILLERQVKSIVIFGSGEVSNLVAKDCVDKNIQVLAFLDNNIERHKITMNNIKIVSPMWLNANANKIQAIVLGFEGNHDDVIREQMAVYHVPSSVHLYSWRQLVGML